MNLRAVFPQRQLLFASILASAALAATHLRADFYITQDGQRHEAKILGATGTSLQVSIPTGQLGVPLATVKGVEMPVPPEFAAAQKLVASKEYQKALGVARSLSEKFKGLPADWAQQVAGMVADLFLTTGDFDKAESAFKDFQKLYPGAGSLQAEVGMARVALSKEQFDEARQKLEPIAEAALKEKFPSKANGVAYSQAFLAIGQIKEKEGDKVAALESYLRTVALFGHDSASVALAQERADKLIAEKIVTP
jgi:tetratricopeptide (TPR) repeat protein